MNTPRHHAPHRRHTRSAAFTLAVAAILSIPLPAAAQERISRPPGSRSQPRAAQPAPAPAPSQAAARPKTAVVEFAQDPLVLETVGLTMQVPMGATVSLSRAGTNVSATVTPPDSAWILSVQTPSSTNTSNTAKDVADKVQKELLNSVAVLDNTGNVGDTEGSLIFREPDDFTLAALSAARFYVRLPQGSGRPALIRGYTVAALGSGRFLVFDLVTTEDKFAAVRPIYETTIATATVGNQSDIAAQRGAAIESGARILEQIDETALRELLGDSKNRRERWHRLFRPAPSGSPRDAEEVAYRRIRTWVGRRGELDPTREQARWSPAERQEGYLMRIDARTLDPNYATTKGVIDSLGLFFLSLDKSDEAWVIRMTQRAGTQTLTATETGARAGNSMQITTTTRGDAPQAIKPFVPERGYVSQLENFLLPQLLIRSGIDGDFAFYVYRSEFGNIRLRSDSLSKMPDRPGVWRLATRQLDEPEPQIAFFNSNGDLIRSELPDGRVWEPIELPRLLSLWESKGLPTK